MKKISFALALIAFTSFAQAAALDTCFNKLDDNCRSLHSNIFRNLTGEVNCKIVNGGNRETDGTRFDRKVVFFDHNSIVSVETPQGNSKDLAQQCNVARGNINGSVIDSKSSAGRLYFINNMGQFFSVTRTNAVYEILTLNGNSFSHLTAINMNGTDIVLTDDRGRTLDISLLEMTRRINTRSLARQIR